VKKYLPFLVLLALLFGVGITSLAQGLNLKSLYIFSAGHFPHPDIVILAIDNKSIGEIGRWPWERAVEARVLDKLKAFSPRAVGVDINFSEKSDASNDIALVESMRSATFPIVLPVETIQFKEGGSQLLLPLAELRSLPNVTLGHVDATLSADQNAVALPNSKNNNGDLILPFGEVIAKKAGAQLPSSEEHFNINFAGPAGTFTTYSLSDFLSDKIPTKDLKDKVILIGATANDLHDVVPVPLGSGLMAGVEWHANIIDNILLNRLWRTLPELELSLLGTLLALLLLLTFFRVQTKTALIVTVLVLVAIPIFSYLGLRSNLFIPYFWSELTVLASFLGYSLVKWYVSEVERRRIKRTVQNYFSPAVLDVILKDPKSLSLGGERKEVTILFSDIRSFTTITESMPPEKLTHLLHEYFTEMTEEIFATDGVLDKFIGDAVMAFWGTPLDGKDHADRAVKAAQGMMRRLTRLQKKWADEGLPLVNIGIGIHTGLATVGNMGSEKRFDYTVIGDAVNAASRLEGLNKEYKTNIIISEATKEKLKEQVNCNPLGEVTVKGKTVPIKIYSITEW
jgi:adenylate cyclase